jgi:alpha-mannosidase
VPITDDGTFYRFDTAFYSISVDKGSGEIDTLFDKRTQRFVVRRGAFAWRNRNGTLNQFQIHDEEPAPMSSWSIGRIGRIRSLISGASSTIVEDGPIRRILRFEHAFDESRIVQNIVFEYESPRIDFRTQVEWGEYGDSDRAAPMLRVVFVPDVEPVEALYEIPFGTLGRPCQDKEQPSLRFVDLVDATGEFGFAVLNDGKHGHRVKGNVLELALIRSGWLPDQRSDIGHHEFTYSILPHPGGTFESSVLAESAFLNLATLTARCLPGDRQGRLPMAASFVRIESGTAVLSALKCAESGNGWVVRLYDPTGRGGKTRLRVFGPASLPIFRYAEETDLLERPTGAVIPLVEGGLDVAFSPYEIRTFRMVGGD